MNDAEKDIYYKQGFTEAQVEELEAGKKAGLDISIYENVKLTPMHMYQIRLGLEAGVDMRPYSDGRFDWFQIEEIRKGIADGHDISKYCDPSIPSDKMHQMRRGLDDEMDLSDYLKYDAAVMRQVRKAFVDRIDITNYVKDGYDANQLEVIRGAINEGLDIQQYLSPEFRAVSISQIAEGLRDGVDVELYAKTCYTWTQMREIRLGLMEQLDVLRYISPLYDRYQMQEIRLGLRDGLPVDEYSSFMYPSATMHKMRLALINKDSHDEAVASVEEINEKNRDGLTVRVTKDDMLAFLTFDSAMAGTTTRKDILRTLRLVGITQNIDPRMLDDLLSGKHLDEEVLIAKGRPPVQGADGYFEYFFETQKEHVPKLNPDGSVDFQEIDWFEQVKKNQKLAYYHSAGKGEPGFSVTGKILQPKKGKELTPLRAKGVIVREDKKTYVSEYDGRVELDGNTLQVSRNLTVPEVTLSTGNIRFAGNVEVLGDVGSGTKIEADGDIVINGFVEGAYIVAGGDIILKKGVNGQGIGVLSAKGSVEGKFFESASVRAGKNITMNYALNSNLYSEDTIKVYGGKGLILGGRIFAVREINVHTLGNDVGTKSYIKLGISDAMAKEKREIEEKLAELDGELQILEKGKSDLDEKYPPEIRSIMDIYLKIENAIYTLGLQKDETLERKEVLYKQMKKTVDAKLVITGILYEGNIIDINGRKIVATQAQNVTAMVKGNHAGLFSNVKG